MAVDQTSPFLAREQRLVLVCIGFGGVRSGGTAAAAVALTNPVAMLLACAGSLAATGIKANAITRPYFRLLRLLHLVQNARNLPTNSMGFLGSSADLSLNLLQNRPANVLGPAQAGNFQDK